ncbi:hypothetical protein, partial [Acinetobacter ursingii]|uniref:hypothetical protein n=1 Tax=Acinetobacter ursingii TaxID=108980 RepID=UPI003AF8D1D0
MEFRSNPICNHRARIGSYTFLSTMYKLFYTMYDKVMCAEKTGGFNLVNHTYSSGVYHEQETQDVYG